MLTSTSKRVKEVVEKMCLTVVVCLKWGKDMDELTISSGVNRQFTVFRQLAEMTDRWYIITLKLANLPAWRITSGGVVAESLPGLLVQ